MLYVALVVVVGVGLLVVIGKLYSPGLNAEIDEVSRGGDPAKLLAAIGKRSAHRRPNAYNRAIRTLWDSYQRERAIPLIRELAARYDRERIAQYWLEQLRTVEPELAARHLDEEFLAEHYQAEVAHACGPAG